MNGFGWLCNKEGKSPRVVGTSLGFAGIRLHLHLVEGEGGFGWHDGPEHVAVVGQGVHAGHGDLAHRQEVLRVLWPQTGRANLQSKETGKGVTQRLGEYTVVSFTSVFCFKTRADVPLGILQGVSSPGDCNRTPKPQKELKLRLE